MGGALLADNTFPCSWSPLAGATGYGIELLNAVPSSTDPLADPHRIGVAVTVGTSWPCATPGLAAGTYWYRLVAWSQRGFLGAFSAADSFVVPKEVLSVDATDPRHPLFSWQPFPTASGYGVELLRGSNALHPNDVSADPNRLAVGVTAAPVTSWRGDTAGLTVGTYAVRAIAWNGAGFVGGFSDAIPFTVTAGQVARVPLPEAPLCPLLPADNVWNTDISNLPVNSSSQAWLSSMSAATNRLHPDFGPSGSAMPYGFPYIVVGNSQPSAAVSFLYANESDPGPYPFDGNTPIEGGPDATGDRHALMVNRDTCTLYELGGSYWNAGHPTAWAGAVFDLRSNTLRPAGWTSSDAAGLPILPGLLRLDEVNAGAVNHAIRFTAVRTDRSYLWPARHQAGAALDSSLPPMGARFRLQAGFDVSHYSPRAQVVLRAMQHYGLILADNGSNWFFSGSADPGWDTSLLDELKTVPASAFEAVDESSLMVDPNSGQARQH
jgi:hypothetical protein